MRLAREAVRRGRASAILVADDLAGSRRERLVAAWRGAGVAVHDGWTKDELGELAGRPAVAALTVTDRNIAAGIAALERDAGRGSMEDEREEQDPWRR